jgi:hypothetical protein
MWIFCFQSLLKDGIHWQVGTRKSRLAKVLVEKAAWCSSFRGRAGLGFHLCLFPALGLPMELGRHIGLLGDKGDNGDKVLPVGTWHRASPEKILGP